MRKVTITGPRQAEIVDVPDPRAKDDWVVVRVEVAPMCTEYKAYAGGWESRFLGHEAAGEVVEVAQPGKVRVGDRVVVMPQYPCGKCALCLAGDYIHCQSCRSVEDFTGSPEGSATMAQYLVKHDWLLVPIPDGMSYDHAGAACCALGPTFGACERMRVSGMDTVLITGLGPVGLGGVINARYRGARVIAVEGYAYRRQLALDLGALAALEPGPDAAASVRELTNGLGADKAIDCSGSPEAQALCFAALRRRGAMAFVGEAGDLTLNVSNVLIRNGLELHGVWHYPLAGTPAIMRVIADSGAALDRLITHRLPLERVAEAFELQMTGACGKVLLYPWS